MLFLSQRNDLSDISISIDEIEISRIHDINLHNFNKEMYMLREKSQGWVILALVSLCQ